MPRDLPEADWKACRKLQAVALERFCERIIGQVSALVEHFFDVDVTKSQR